MCDLYRPGHLMHYIHVREANRRPWGWRAGTVSRVDDLTVVVAYVDGGTVTVWHHQPVAGLAVGYPVRVHEEFHALEAGRALLNVVISDGVGAVPEPDDAAAWRRSHVPAPVVVVDVRTGRGVRDVPAD